MKRRRSSFESEEVAGGVDPSTSTRSKKRKLILVDPWDVPPNLYNKVDLCHKLYESLRSLKDSDNQLLSEYVVRVPNRRSVPEYYKIVPHPIDLIKIQQKLKTEEYVSLPLFLADVRLLIDNTKLFYKPSSVEYKRSTALERSFLKCLHDICSSEVNADTPLSPKTVSLKLSSLNVPEKSSKKGPTTPGGGASNSKKGPVKTTRSKAWLDEYASSDDPVKIYFGDVYSYHDNAGEYIAQPFIDLPSKKDYPEYYRVITEPIGLSIIRSQLEAGYYCNLKAIQDDLLLMIKNAQYFNEPQSAIYKMASTLRRFIISRCLELERKYRTVEKTAKLKSPSPGLTGSRDVLQKHSDTDSDGVSDSDSNADDSEGEGKQRLLLHIKRDTSSSKTKDPLAKILRAKSLPSSRKLYLACYRAITRATDNDGRVISELFMKRPSAKLYPEYYIVIKSPIDFKEIYSKIKHDLYKTLLEMMDDVELLVNNAITFNEEYSQIHTDALAIRALSVKVMEQIQSKWPQIFTGVTRKVHPMLSQISSISTLFAVIKNSIDSSGRKIWLSLQDVPPPSREGESYCGSKKPVGLANIGQKVDSNNYQSVDDLFSDLCYLFECYCDHYSSQHQLYKDAVSLHRLSVTKYNELTHEQRASYQYPSAPDVVKKMLKDIMNSLMEAKDGDGNRLCDVLQPVIVCQESTDEDKTKRVFTIDKLSQWVNGGRYSRLDQLQVDILSIFREARQKNKEFGREMIKASLTFERQYINIRDEICRNILWSSALTDRTLQHVEDEGEEMEGSLDEVDDDNTIQMESLTIPSSGDRIIKDSHRIGDVVYHPGDFVYLPPREPHLPSQIALIESTWMDKVGNSWFDGCWFFRPHETFHPATRKFYEHEVFKSDFYSSALLSSVIGKCFVLFIKDYTKFYPQGFSEEDVYVCESRYIYKHKSIKKIKFWNVQQNVHVKLLPRLAPCPLNKVPSVFAAGIDKSDEELQMSKGSSCISKDIKTPDDDDLDSNSSGSLERSFFRELKEVTIIVNNPEDNCTYFQQYCIDDKIFKLGDFVYVRSDQAQPFIARIDRMWTDSNEDPWFHGPWFVRTTEIEHVPTHMFYEKELFMSNIQDTNPMRSIIRKCAVLHPTDFVKWRPTEILETDVYVCESKYNEDEKLLKKMKNLKQYDLSDLVLQDERYHLPKPVILWKRHSPLLFPPTIVAPITTVISTTTTTTTTTTATTTATIPISSNVNSSPLIAVPVSSGQVTISLQQLQSLLSINQSKPLMAPTDTVLAYPCVWEGCQEIFEDGVDLGSHILSSSHIHMEVDGTYYCYWSQCPRKRDLGGKPFDSLQKMTRHIKEVHLLRVYPQQVPLAKLNTPHYHQRGSFMRPPIIEPTVTGPSLSPAPVDVTTPLQLAKAVKTAPLIFGSNPPSEAVTNNSNIVHSPMTTPLGQHIANSVNITPGSVNITQPMVPSGAAGGPPHNVTQLANVTPVAIPPNQSMTPPTDVTPNASAMQPHPTAESLVSSVFIAPPTNQKQVIHSQIYMNYIERMRNNEPTISSWVGPPTSLPQSLTDNVSQWIDPAAIPRGMTPNDALHQLYHHLIQDAVNISMWMDNMQ